jgi:hypothetical protein
MVGLGTGGKVSIYNGYGTTDAIVDVDGWYTDISIGGTGSRFVPVTPARILDSRYGTGGYSAPWGPNSGHPVTVAGQGGVPLMTDPNIPTAVVANITITGPTTPGALTAWPDTAAPPVASDLNWVPGLTVPNLAVIQVGPSGKVDLLNYDGCVDVIMDVVGWFTGPAPKITTAPPPASSPCPVGSWLTRLNYWRSTAHVPPVTENPTWSQGAYLHSIYMVRDQQATNYETVGAPYYTAAGDYAARNGNILVAGSTAFTDSQAMDAWMAEPFHATNMMDPNLTWVGFGSYRYQMPPYNWSAAFSINTLSGNPFRGGVYPVMWPGNGSTVPLRTYLGNEYPNALSVCPGYTVPSGLPVFIEVGVNVTTSVSASSFTGNGAPLTHCVISSANDPSGGLHWRGGAIVVPKAPLQPGVLYAVALTVNGTPYSWSFEVS